MKNKPAPPQLRLLVDEESQPFEEITETPLDRLCLGISALSGWQLERTPILSPDNCWNRVMLPDDHTREWLCVTPDNSGGLPPQVPQGLVCELAGYLHELADETYALRRELAAREAELATAIPVVVDLKTDALKLAQKLEAVLRGGAQAIGCSSAGLYLLDDATEYLKLRCHWNQSAQAHLAPPRELRTAAADVEALAGHAIAIEDSHDTVNWEIPLAARAAICVPVASATTLLGTLWAFHSQPRAFSDHDTNLWEIIAGRVAAELEREALLRDRRPARQRSDGPQACDVPVETLDAVQTDIWAATTRVNAAEIDRNVIVDMSGADEGSVQALAIVAHDDGLAGASHAFRSFAQWHMEPHADDFLDKVHDELYRDSTGDSFVSAVSINLDNASGKVSLQAAGHVESFIIRPFAWEPCTKPTRALGDASATRIGCKSEATLCAADWLLVVLGAIPRALRVHDTPLIDGKCLAETLLRLHELDLDHAADSLWRLIQEQNSGWRHPPSMMLVRRIANIEADLPL